MKHSQTRPAGEVERSAGLKYIPELNQEVEVTFNYTKHADKRPDRRKEIEGFYAALLSVCDGLNIENILDVGCGEGFSLDRLDQQNIGKRYVGIDNSKVAVELGKKLFPGLNLSVGDIYNLDLADNTYDLVMCTEVLEHLAYPEIAIEEIKRVSKKYVVLSVPHEPFFSIRNLLKGKHLKRLGNTPGHINWWTSLAFRRLIKKHGLKIIKTVHPFPFTLALAEK